MNGDRTRPAGVGDEKTERDDGVDKTATELEPMCSDHQQRNSTAVDGYTATEQPSEAEKQDSASDGDANWRTIGDILEHFAEDTSLLGVPRAILAPSRLARLFWVVVCVTCMIMFIEGCTQSLKLYFEYPKQVRSIEHFTRTGENLV